MRILSVTTLYPNAAEPMHGIFVENRLARLARLPGVDLRVLAPVPWFPFTSEQFGRYAAYARAPRRETRQGIRIAHPRFFVPPKIGMTASPLLLLAALRGAVRRLSQSGWECDVIDAHYLYPDGVAAVLLARELAKPVTVTARGSDVAVIARDHALPRSMVRWASRKADAIITVSHGLRDDLLALGARPARLRVLRNGVDLELFKPPLDRAGARRALGLRAPTVLSVGRLVPGKRHDMPIRALVDLPDFTLLIVGDGPERGRLEAVAREAGVAGRVRFLGRVPHEALPAIYGAVDALILASVAEGWANVLLEAMACGTPVVGSDIAGNREVIAEPGGVVMRANDAGAAAEAIRHVIGRGMEGRRAARIYAERFAWEEVSRGQLELFTEILAARRCAQWGRSGGLRVSVGEGSG